MRQREYYFPMVEKRRRRPRLAVEIAVALAVKFAALAVRKVYDMGWKPVHYLNNVGASVGSVLTPAGLEKAVGLVTVAYLKDAVDTQWTNDPAMKEYLAFMAKYAPSEAGSSCHIHISLWKGGRNLFCDDRPKKSIGVEQYIVLEENIVNADDAFLAKHHIV